MSTSVPPAGTVRAPRPSFPAARLLSPALDRALAERWPNPAPARRRLVLTALGVGLVTALLVPDAPRPGVNLLICGLAAAVPVGFLAYRQDRADGGGRRIGRVRGALAAVALALPAVSAVRASEWLSWGCVLAALCLAAAVALDVRRWPAVLATVPLFGVAVLRALPWAGRGAQAGDLRTMSRSWLTGLGIGVGVMVVVAALLASADDAFADAIGLLQPAFRVDQVVARLLVFLFAAGTTLGAMFAVSTRLTEPRPAVAGARHPAEWAIPVVLVGLTIAAFLAVEATMLFGGAEVVERGDSLSHAERAREGFGQLTVVTLIVLVLLAWAGRAAAGGPPRHRRLMGAVGGALLVLALLLATSALRRLWLYQDASGWTVTRVNAGAFELWVAVVLVVVALGWLLRRTDLLARFVIGSAGLGLLVVGMAGPDALVAAANVERFQQTGRVDTAYLSELSADAVPALYRLPEPERSCALYRQSVAGDPWFRWNRARARADELLRSRPPGECLDGR